MTTQWEGKIGSRYQPSYAGIPTFFRAPFGEVDTLTKGDVAVVGAPFDSGIGFGRSGTRYGPRAVREESCHYAAFYCTMPERTVVDLERGVGFRIPEPLPLVDLGDVDIQPADVAATTKAVADGMQRVVARGALPLLIGGDHYLVYPSVKGVTQGLQAHDPDVRVGYLHIDSHTDLFDELPCGGRHNNATSVRRVTETPGVSTSHMAWVGLNGRLVSKEQYDFAQAKDLLLISAADIRGANWEDIVATAIERVADADCVYVSVDIDAVDGASAPGTTAAVFEGMDPARFLRILELVGGLRNLAALDLCEVSPRLDPTGRTARLGALALITVIGERLFDKVEVRKSTLAARTEGA